MRQLHAAAYTTVFLVCECAKGIYACQSDKLQPSLTLYHFQVEG